MCKQCMAILCNCASGYSKFKQFQDMGGGGGGDLHLDKTPTQVP